MSDTQSPATGGDDDLVAVCSVEELTTAGKLVLQHGDDEIVLFWNGGSPGAVSNACIHRERALSQGVLLNNRVVCPGHQWSFDLHTGWCKERERTQPTYRVEVRDGTVHISTSPHYR